MIDPISWMLSEEAFPIHAEPDEKPDPKIKSVESIDTVPPQAVQRNARRALEVREGKPASERGMTAVGIARARDLANGASLSEETIRRMVAYFERHQSDKQGSTWDEQGKGWQAWMGWGGDEGWAWAKRKRDEFDRARSEKSVEAVLQKDCGTGAGGFKEGNTCGGKDGDGEKEKPKRTPRSRKPKTSEPVDRPSNEDMAKESAAAVAELDKVLDKPDAWKDMEGEFVEERKMAVRQKLSAGIKSALQISEAVSVLEEDSGNKRNALLRLQRIDAAADADIVNAANYFDSLSASGQREYLATIDRGVRAVLGDRISKDFTIEGTISGADSQPEAMERCAMALKVASGLVRAASIFDFESDAKGKSILASGVTIASRAERVTHPNASAFYQPQTEVVTIFSDAYNALGGTVEQRTRGTGSPAGWGSRIMVHELAHGNHYISEKKRSGSFPKWDSIPDSQARVMRANGMRDYAFTNQVEFVACFADEVSIGARFDEELWKLYDQQGGPKIRASVRRAATLRIPK